MVDEDDGRPDALPEPLVATLEDPATGRRRVPYLLGLLDRPDPRRRLAAGTALCLVAEADPELRDVVVGRLVDRFDESAPPEVGRALDYLAVRYGDAVEAAVAGLDEATEQRARERLSRATRGGFARSDYTPANAERRSGRDSAPDPGTGTDPRQVYTNSDRSEHEDRPGDAGAEPADGEPGSAGGAERGDERTERRPTDSDAGEEWTGGSVTAETLRTVSRRLSAVVGASEFDDLTVLSEGRRDRYGDAYRAAGRLDGDDYAVALTVYRLPADHGEFLAEFGAVLDDWGEVGDHRAVLPVYDWGVRPRPWAAAEYAGTTLARREGEPTDPLWTVLELAAGLTHAHQHGVVHGGVDPGNVAYRDAVLDGSSRRQPLLTDPGLATLPGVDHVAGPDRSGLGSGADGENRTGPPGVVDPRYAAPEHYDRTYGRVDAATDVYGLGTLLYRLCTGRPPYTGDAATVAEAVCSDERPTPTDANADLPAELDRVVGKATATRKLKRYETVTAFERELRNVREQLGETDDD